MKVLEAISNVAGKYFAFWTAAALPSVLAAVWHNIAGPILATIWSKMQRTLSAMKMYQ